MTLQMPDLLQTVQTTEYLPMNDSSFYVIAPEESKMADTK